MLTCNRIFPRLLSSNALRSKWYSTGSTNYNNSKYAATTMVSLSVITGGALLYYLINESEQPGVLTGRNSKFVHQSILPFPMMVSPNDNVHYSKLSTQYTMLGTGIINDYAIGLYVAIKDQKLIRQCFNYRDLVFNYSLSKENTHPDNVKSVLQDDVISSKLYGSLLDSNIELLVKITVLLNAKSEVSGKSALGTNSKSNNLFSAITDTPNVLNTLPLKPIGTLGDIIRDNIVLSKYYNKDNTHFTAGLQQLQSCFNNKPILMDVNDDLMIELSNNGGLVLNYYCSKENTLVPLGKVNEPIIGRVLFLDYLSSKKSNELRQDIINTIITIV